ncbi:MAG: DsbA family oxidoreductase, partial [Actinomycetota bacterium]
MSRAAWLERRYGAEIRWIPFDLHPEYPPEGISRRDIEARFGTAFMDRVRQMIEEAGYRYAPPPFIPNSSLPLELAELARDRGVFAPVHRRLFASYWSEGRDIGDPAVLLEIGTEAGLDADEIRGSLAERPRRQRIAEATKGAIELGIGGVPAFVLDESLYVSGAQPESLFERAMERLGHRPV